LSAAVASDPAILRAPPHIRAARSVMSKIHKERAVVDSPGLRDARFVRMTPSLPRDTKMRDSTGNLHDPLLGGDDPWHDSDTEEQLLAAASEPRQKSWPISDVARAHEVSP
jgi:hypothetical protein